MKRIALGKEAFNMRGSLSFHPKAKAFVWSVAL